MLLPLILICFIITFAVLWNHSRKFNNPLPGSGTELRVGNLAIANLRSYPLNCAAASQYDNVKYLSQEHSSVMPSLGIELATLRLLFGALTD